MNTSDLVALEPIGYFNEEGQLVRFNQYIKYERNRDYIESSGFQLAFAVEQRFRKNRNTAQVSGSRRCEK